MFCSRGCYWFLHNGSYGSERQEVISMTADELVTLYLLLRRINAMAREQKYRDHPFRERLESLMDSAYKTHHLDVQQIADELDLNKWQLNDYVRGYNMPYIPTLIKIADYFGVSTDYLLGREGYEIEENE